MNANTNSARFTNAKTGNCKKFCKVCFDAGKPENVYTNHTVKTMNARTGKLETTCVTLLALECRFCFTTGHTVKFCPAIKENNKGRKEHEIQHARERHAATVAQQEAATKQKTVVKKGFALLQEESDDDDEVVAPVVQTVVENVDFPALPVKAGGAPKLQTVMSFAATAALPPKPKVTFAAVAPVPVPIVPIAFVQDHDDSDYEEDDNEDCSEPQTPAVSYTDSCFSYRERHGYEEDNSW